MILNLLKKFNYIEPNNLKGLQPGFVVAQIDTVDSGLLKDGYFENGKLCTISAAGIVAATEDSKVVFIHYTEPLNTIVSGDEYFAINPEEECPRLVQLIPGDEWMSTEDLGDSILGGRVVKVTKATGWHSVTTMANGDKGYHYMFLG